MCRVDIALHVHSAVLDGTPMVDEKSAIHPTKGSL